MIKLASPERDPHLPEIHKAVQRVIDSGRYLLGPETEKLEQTYREMCSADYAVAVSNCSDALYISYSWFPNLVIGMPALTFVATAESAKRAGCHPYFFDRRTDSRIMPVVDVPLFGVESGLKQQAYITDRAHCFPSKFNSQLAECYSFFPAKPLGCLGDGGMIVTNNKDFYEFAVRARNHGSADRRNHVQVGGNHRMGEIQAACLNVKLGHLDYYKRRLENVEYLRSRVAIVGKTYANCIGEPVQEVFETKQYYPMLVPEHRPYYRNSGRTKDDCRDSHWFSKWLWAVPCGAELTSGELDMISRALDRVYGPTKF